MRARSKRAANLAIAIGRVQRKNKKVEIGNGVFEFGELGCVGYK